MHKVSIIVPVYNMEKYLRKCLDSLINQTYENIEIIIINDGSTDNSDEIINEYAKKHNNIVYYSKENEGVSLTRNRGLDLATGEYIMFVDSDDYVSSDIVETLINLAVNNDLDIVTSDIIKFYTDGTEEYFKTNKEFSVDEVKNYIIGDSGPCAKLFKKEIINKIRFRKIAYEDLDVIPVLGLYTSKMGYINKAMYYYRQIDGSATRLIRFNNSMLDIFDVLDNLYNQLYKRFPDETEYLYITHLLRSASLRFLDYPESKEYLYRINLKIKELFPNWKLNQYYIKSSRKMKLVCQLAYRRKYGLLKIIKKCKK